MELNLTELANVAQRATHGKWKVDAEPEKHGFYSNVIVEGMGETIATCGFYEKKRSDAKARALANKNANFIATFSPAVVLELIHRLRHMEEQHGSQHA